MENNIKIHKINLEGKLLPVGYKVVTMDLKSLGLRSNQHIYTYPINKWYFLPKNQVLDGADDWGGIWLARTLSGAKKLREYMKKKYNEDTRIFISALDKNLYSNSYRIKTNGINMLKEIANNQ